MGLLKHIRKESLSNKEINRKQLEKLKALLYEKLGYKGMLEISSKSEDIARSELQISLRSILNTSGASLDPSHADILIQALIDEILGLGPLESLLNDEQVTEIMVNGMRSMFYEKGGKLHQIEQVFISEEQIRVLIDRIISPLGRRLDEQSPIVNARLKSGYRVNAVIPPLSIDGPCLTIRKFSDRISSLDELVDLGSIPKWYAMLLSFAVRDRQNIAVVGGTGSGKTTLLNALSCEIPKTERIITIEDSAELKFKSHPHVVRLEKRDASIEGLGEVSIRDLVINALRMRPDRIVVGECRGAEAIDMLQAMNTGHDGSLTTLHAGSPDEAIMRLILMSRFGIDLPTDVIEEQIASALDLIVMQARLGDGKRLVTELCRVSRGEDGGVKLENLVDFNSSTRTYALSHPDELMQKVNAIERLSKDEVSTWYKLLP